MEGVPFVRFRQRSFIYGDAGTLVHVSQQCFADYIWVLITEDDTCAPGTVLRFDPQEGGPGFNWENPNMLQSSPCETLLGLRDCPLTNIAAGVIAQAIQREGEERSVLLCISLRKTADRLQCAGDRMAFVRMLKDEVMILATGGKPV